MTQSVSIILQPSQLRHRLMKYTCKVLSPKSNAGVDYDAWTIKIAIDNKHSVKLKQLVKFLSETLFKITQSQKSGHEGSRSNHQKAICYRRIIN